MKVIVYGEEKDTAGMLELLNKEIPQEVKRIVTRRNFEDMSAAQIWMRTERDVYPYIGEDSLIVLTHPLGSMVAGSLIERFYPKQKTVWYGKGATKVMKGLKAAYVLVAWKIRRMEIYQQMKAVCQETKIIEHDGEEWKEFIGRTAIDKMEITEKVKSTQGAPIFVLHPEIPVRRVKEIVDWRNEVIDFEEMMLQQIKAKLGIKDYL